MHKDTPSDTQQPLYVSVEKAARICGVGRDVMKAWTDDPVDPIPHLRGAKGVKRLVRVSAIGPYARTREVKAREWDG